MGKRHWISLGAGISLSAVLIVAVVRPWNAGQYVEAQYNGRFTQVTIDYSSDPSPDEVGYQLGTKLLQVVPDFEAVLETFVSTLTKDQYEQYMQIASLIRPQIPKNYQLEIDGMSRALSGATAANVAGDKKVTRDELYLINLYVDIRGGECCALAAYADGCTTGTSASARLLDWPYFDLVAKLHCVTKIVHANGTYMSVGFAGLNGCLTGVNGKNVFGGILFTHTGKKFTYTSPHSILFDLRSCLENGFDLQATAKTLLRSDVSYVMNSVIALSDEKYSGVVENDFSPPAGSTQPCRGFRVDSSALNPGVSWGVTSRIAAVNGFVLKGAFDNVSTQPYNAKRWNNIRTFLAKTGTKSTPDDIRSIISWYSGSQPGDFNNGDIYDQYTEQIVLYQPGMLGVFFREYGKPLPLKPDFITIRY